MATDTITVYKKAQEIFLDIAKYIETRIEQQNMNQKDHYIVKQKKLEEELSKKKNNLTAFHINVKNTQLLKMMMMMMLMKIIQMIKTKKKQGQQSVSQNKSGA